MTDKCLHPDCDNELPVGIEPYCSMVCWMHNSGMFAPDTLQVCKDKTRETFQETDEFMVKNFGEDGLQ